MNTINLDWFSFWSGIVPNQKAVTILKEDLTYTYGEINRKGHKIAQSLYHDFGVRKGDRVGVLAKNCIENIYLFAAAQKLGAILVPFNYRLTAYELSQLIADAEPTILFFDEEFKMETTTVQTLSLSELHRFEGGKPLELQNYSAKEPIFILYTSGSTGVPKGVLYTHEMLYWNSLNTSISLGINSDTNALVCMPPFHTGGWNVLLTPVLHHGGHVMLTEKFDADQILNVLRDYRCNQFMAVPTMLKMMAVEPVFKDLKLPELPYIIVGGEALSIDLIKVYEKKGISVRQGFGMTEAGPNLTSLHQDQSVKKIGSIGKPNMYVSVKLIDEKGQEVEAGALGELCFSGPMVMSSYWRKERESKLVIVNNYLQSGDIAMMDEEGYLYIKDRKKNMFISGGENVYPAEVEKELQKHEAINDAVVLGVPDKKWGEVGKAFIVLNEAVEKEEISTFCRARLSKYKIPKYYQYIDGMPLNSTGKIDKKALAKM